MHNFQVGDHIIFRGWDGEDIYGTIVGVSDMPDRFRVKTETASWHVHYDNITNAD